jgi:hypothetical protein
MKHTMDDTTGFASAKEEWLCLSVKIAARSKKLTLAPMLVNKYAAVAA